MPVRTVPGRAVVTIPPAAARIAASAIGPNPPTPPTNSTRLRHGPKSPVRSLASVFSTTNASDAASYTGHRPTATPSSPYGSSVAAVGVEPNRRAIGVGTNPVATSPINNVADPSGTASGKWPAIDDRVAATVRSGATTRTS